MRKSGQFSHYKRWNHPVLPLDWQVIAILTITEVTVTSPTYSFSCSVSRSVASDRAGSHQTVWGDQSRVLGCVCQVRWESNTQREPFMSHHLTRLLYPASAPLKSLLCLFVFQEMALGISSSAWHLWRLRPTFCPNSRRVARRMSVTSSVSHSPQFHYQGSSILILTCAFDSPNEYNFNYHAPSNIKSYLYSTHVLS